MRKFLLAAVASLGVASIGDAHADGYLDVVVGTAGSVIYEGDGVALAGDVAVASIVGIGTPLRGGRPMHVDATTRLQFQTGPFQRAIVNGWRFGPGGSFQVVDSREPGKPLLVGIFNGVVDVIATNDGVTTGEFKVVTAGILVEAVRADIAKHYGFDGTVSRLGGVSILFASPPATPGDPFASSAVLGGNTAVNVTQTLTVTHHSPGNRTRKPAV